MVNQNMAVANGRNPDFDPDADFANSAALVNGERGSNDLRADAFGGESLGAFVSADELEEFLRNFSEGEGDEATLQTQGTDDIGGEPTTTVH